MSLFSRIFGSPRGHHAAHAESLDSSDPRTWVEWFGSFFGRTVNQAQPNLSERASNIVANTSAPEQSDSSDVITWKQVPHPPSRTFPSISLNQAEERLSQIERSHPRATEIVRSLREVVVAAKELRKFAQNFNATESKAFIEAYDETIEAYDETEEIEDALSEAIGALEESFKDNVLISAETPVRHNIDKEVQTWRGACHRYHAALDESNNPTAEALPAFVETRKTTAEQCQNFACALIDHLQMITSSIDSMKAHCSASPAARNELLEKLLQTRSNETTQRASLQETFRGLGPHPSLQERLSVNQQMQRATMVPEGYGTWRNVPDAAGYIPLADDEEEVSDLDSPSTISKPALETIIEVEGNEEEAEDLPTPSFQEATQHLKSFLRDATRSVLPSEWQTRAEEVTELLGSNAAFSAKVIKVINFITAVQTELLEPARQEHRELTQVLKPSQEAILQLQDKIENIEWLITQVRAALAQFVERREQVLRSAFLGEETRAGNKTTSSSASTGRSIAKSSPLTETALASLVAQQACNAPQQVLAPGEKLRTLFGISSGVGHVRKEVLRRELNQLKQAADGLSHQNRDYITAEVNAALELLKS